jgi:eukaryotic-like serine/threonine-protein kinase
LEYLPGPDLASLSTNDAGAMMKVLYQISSGIADMHSSGLLHRDIKPKNMKFDSNGVIKLFDFGLSCDADDAVTVARRGTREYRAPEFYGDGPVALTPAVDTYAFGVTAWKLIAQTLPWELRTSPPRLAPSFAQLQIGLPDEIRNALSNQLLNGNHQGSLVYVTNAGTNTRKLNSTNNRVRIRVANIGSVSINYTGLDFRLIDVSGDVFINGVAASEYFKLPDSCVLILGAPSLGSKRLFITFDVSHPEVVL